MHARIPARILFALALGGGLALTGQVSASTDSRRRRSGRTPPVRSSGSVRTGCRSRRSGRANAER